MGDNEEAVLDADQISTESARKQEPQKRVRKRSGVLLPIPPEKFVVSHYFTVLQALNAASDRGKNFVKYDEVAPFAGLHAASVSSILKFLFDIGFLERENKMYKPTPETIDYLNELEWNEPNSGKYLRPILLRTWFGENIIKLFNVQKEVKKEDLIRVLGRQAHADKSDNNSLSKLVDLLIYGDIIKLDESSGKYSLINDLQNPKSERPLEIMTSHEQEQPCVALEEEKPNLLVSSTPANLQSATKVNYNFNFNLTIENVEDIESVLKKLREFQQDIDTINDANNT